MRDVSPRRGFSLVEMLTVVAILGLIAVAAVPAFFNLRRKHAVRAAGREIRGVFHEARSRAIARGCNTAIRFRNIDGQWAYAIYEDGDADGVRNDDIADGIDPAIAGFRKLLQGVGGAHIGLPHTGVRDPDTRELIRASASPVRFNRSQICSFSPLGEATAGSIFVTDGHDLAMIVRVYGATGKIRSLLYDSGSGRWR